MSPTHRTAQPRAKQERQPGYFVENSSRDGIVESILIVAWMGYREASIHAGTTGIPVPRILRVSAASGMD